MTDNCEKEKKYKYIDYLTEDDPISGQAWVCMSFVSPEGIKNCKIRGLKIRGVYSTKEEADKRCDELSKIDQDFHVFAGEVGKWLPWDPNPDTVKDQNYVDKELNDLVHGYQQNLNNAKQVEAKRKSDLLKKAASEEKAQRVLAKEQHDKDVSVHQEKKEFVQQTLDKLNSTSLDGLSRSQHKKRQQKLKKLQKLDHDVKQNIELVNKESDRLHQIDISIKEEESTVDDIDKDIKKIKKLYSKLKEKQNNNETSSNL